MTVDEAAANPISQKAFSDVAMQEKGFLTASEFNAACGGTDRPAASGEP